MYPSSSSSSSSSSHKSIQTTTGGGGLMRYGSAPSSFLSTAADSVVCNLSSSPSTREFTAARSPMFPPPPRPHQHYSLHHHHHQALHHSPLFGNYFSGDSQSTSKVNAPAPSKEGPTSGVGGGGGGLHRAFGLTETGLGASPSSSAASASASLQRQSSSPAGFLSHLASENEGFSLTCGGGSSNGGASRLKTQLSFTSRDSLSNVSQANENVVKGAAGLENGHHHTNQSYTNFGLDSWESSSNILFSPPPGKRAKAIDGDLHFNTLETQLSLPQTTLEMATVERMLQIPDDFVPCKIRAKRGCSTHPRSIAERERRTRISGRLKKLQELVPNMDKQTSYSDMLDLAVEHIKMLQNHVQRLRRDLNNCTCGCMPSY